MSDRDREVLDMYFRNDLTNQVDKEYFESRSKDKDFKEVLEEETEIIKVLKNYDASRLKNRLEGIESDVRKEKKSYRYIMLLLALLSSIIAWYVFSKSDSKNENDNLYAEFYTPYPNIIDPLTKGSGDTLSVFQNYEKRDFNKVLSELENNTNLSEEQLFYLAMTYLELQNYDEADRVLGRIQKGDFLYDRDWYRALICMKLKRLGCNEKFKALSNNSDNTYSDKAANLLKKLN